jgi:hypothetical protein
MTELSRHLTPEAMQALIDRINAVNKASGEPAFRFKTIEQGAATSVLAGVIASADEVGGRYCEDCHAAEVVADPAVRRGVKPYALNPERAKGAVGEERGDRRRAVLGRRSAPSPAVSCPFALSTSAAPARSRR